jgi:hypothetical protein
LPQVQKTAVKTTGQIFEIVLEEGSKIKKECKNSSEDNGV